MDGSFEEENQPKSLKGGATMERDRVLKNQRRQKDPEMEVLKERSRIKTNKLETDSGDWMRLGFATAPADFLVGASA